MNHPFYGGLFDTFCGSQWLQADIVGPTDEMNARTAQFIEAIRRGADVTDPTYSSSSNWNNLFFYSKIVFFSNKNNRSL